MLPKEGAIFEGSVYMETIDVLDVSNILNPQAIVKRKVDR
jgi:hypothetical protein